MKTFTKLGVLIGFMCAITTPAISAEESVMLMLGGKYCDAYLSNVRDALTKVAGVKAVDVKSMKGHAVVTVESGKVKPEQLVAAINGVKGDSWFCTGEVMK
jgi:periplasmic mercuric ion binding protein